MNKSQNKTVESIKRNNGIIRPREFKIYYMILEIAVIGYILVDIFNIYKSLK